MITNPNTCGLFEKDFREIADAVHAAGGYVYCDGANFNAIVGRVRPGDLGVDAMHINLHKTFSTPHGGGGPGSGPVVLSEALAPYAPLPFVRKDDAGSFYLVEEENREERGPTFGRMTAFHGQMGMFTRALTYILSRRCGAQCQLHPAFDGGYPPRALRCQRAVHARGAVWRQRFRQWPLDARCRQVIDRRRLSPDDGVFPAGGARRDAG
jgi:hypothetical protein